MIFYIEKGHGLHEAIRAAGHWLEQRGDAWYSSNDAAVQAIINAYDPLPAMRAELLAKVAAERIRRQALGVAYVFPDGQAGTIQTRHEQDLVNINGLATRALMAPGATFPFRDEENRTHAMSAEQVAALAVAASDYVGALYAAKWAHDSAIAKWDGTAPYDTTAFWPED